MHVFKYVDVLSLIITVSFASGILKLLDLIIYNKLNQTIIRNWYQKLI